MDFSKHETALLRTVNWNMSFNAWMGFLTFCLLGCLGAYGYQLYEGLHVTGMHDYVSWGMYISNFVFFVAVSLVGMLISSVMGLSGADWVKPIGRIAEIIAVAFAMVAGLIIVMDMGRPDRLHHVFIYGRIQSPIIWDVTVVNTYVAISLLMLLVPLIPDFALMKERRTDLPKLQLKIYDILSFGWTDCKENYISLKRIIRILLILVIPVALAIHTVTSWLFASTLRAGWDTSIFGPYFVSGAFVAGSAAVIIAMFFFQKNYKLQDYITDKHFDNMGKLLVLVSLVYAYFNINELMVPAYKMKAVEGDHLMHLFQGHDAPMFYLVQFGGLVIPIILMLFKPMRKPAPLMVIASVVLGAAWLKRYLIVVPTMLNPHLPIQNVPEAWSLYQPTDVEIAVNTISFIIALMIISVLSKVVPVVPVWEVKEEMEEEAERQGKAE